MEYSAFESSYLFSLNEILLDVKQGFEYTSDFVLLFIAGAITAIFAKPSESFTIFYLQILADEERHGVKIARHKFFYKQRVYKQLALGT